MCISFTENNFWAAKCFFIVRRVYNPFIEYD